MIGYQELEDKVFTLFKEKIGDEIILPKKIKESLGLISTTISNVDAEISKKHDSKTDVLVVFDDGKKLKISIKKDNADYYGNWYTHQRIEKEFGISALEQLIEKTTEWANTWIEGNSSNFFLGVSINFGSRKGNTFMEFNEVFGADDIQSIVQGHDLEQDTSANILLHTNGDVNSIDDIIKLLVIFDQELLNCLFDDVKIIFRPINPMTEGSNRGKQTYTKFVPNSKFAEEKYITTKDDLKKYGSFQPVALDKEYKLNHNRVIRELKEKYNILVNTK